MTKAPLKEMKERFGTKEELVKQLVDRLEKKADEKRDDFIKRLMRVSNGKLLRLYKVTETVYGKFGSKTDLVERLLKLERPTAKKEDSLSKRLFSPRRTPGCSTVSPPLRNAPKSVSARRSR
jgi:DNA-binding transcriptional regulator PaaX